VSRLEILYDGEVYTVPAEEDAYRARVLELVSDGGFHWLEVNRGEGRLEPIGLLIGPGIPIAIGALEPSARADDDVYTAHVEEA